MIELIKLQIKLPKRAFFEPNIRPLSCQQIRRQLSNPKLMPDPHHAFIILTSLQNWQQIHCQYIGIEFRQQHRFTLQICGSLLAACGFGNANFGGFGEHFVDAMRGAFGLLMPFSCECTNQVVTRTDFGFSVSPSNELHHYLPAKIDGNLSGSLKRACEFILSKLF